MHSIRGGEGGEEREEREERAKEREKEREFFERVLLHVESRALRVPFLD